MRQRSAFYCPEPTLSRREAIARSAAWLSLGALAGCSSNPALTSHLLDATGSVVKSAFLGETDEIAIGNGLYGRVIDGAGGYYHDEPAQAALRRFAAPLIATSRRPNLPWEIVLVNDNTVNAWALPGGKLGVNKGLFYYVDSDAELAAVISHEIGHAELGHAVQTMRTGGFMSAAGGLGKAFLQDRANQAGVGAMTGPVLDSLAGPMTQLVMSGYSRENESEADNHILTVYGQTGYRPGTASSFFHTLLELIPPGSMATTSLFSTYPGTQARIVALNDAAAKLPEPTFQPASAGFDDLQKIFPNRKYLHRHPVPV